MTTFDANFIANAGIKDIVGRGLIYDDNIAIIELIKNSKDSGSANVKLYFKLVKDEETGCETEELWVCDSGQGMTQRDIIDKWLNIAYSEKRGTTEAYAGNKGVGRFSCDRLGEKLTLYTKASKGEYLKLPIEWTDFENKDLADEISTIKLQGRVLERKEFLSNIGVKKFKTGTILKIQRLRGEWTSAKLKKLIGEMEKFSPKLEDDFDVYLYSDGYFDERAYVSKLKNGKINNNILSKLTFKTTFIRSEIDSKGKYITTKLYYQGEEIYKYKAVNPYKSLKNIRTEIHYLDTISKAYFTRSSGVNSVSYGSIFLFYNGFRVSPYGNYKNDWLGLDQRKSQGTSRNLGTREIFGRIDILDEDDTFSVITSREGLAHNAAFQDLVAYDEHEKTTLINEKQEYGYITTIIRQLESFVVNGLNWNRMVDKLGKRSVVTLDDVNKNPERYKAKDILSDDVISVLGRMLKSNYKVEEIDINKNLISKIQDINDDKFKSYKKDFIEKTKAKTLAELSPVEIGAVKKIIEASEARLDAAIEERDITEKEVVIAKQELIVERVKNQYLIDSRAQLSPDAEGLIHTIKLTNSKVKNISSNLLDDLIDGEFNRDSLIDGLAKILSNAEKALKMAQLATKAEIDSNIEDKITNIPIFIKEYLASEVESSSLPITLNFSGDQKGFSKKINVLNLSIVLDNLLSNSEKWGANNVDVDFKVTNKEIRVLFSDNGEGVSTKYLECSDALFELGVRDYPTNGITIGGSGIGLYHARENLKLMNSTIKFAGNNIRLSGASFVLEFKK